MLQSIYRRPFRISLVFCCFFLQMNDHDWLLLEYLVPKLVWFSHNEFVFFNTQINSWKSGNKRTIISWGVPLPNRKNNHNANEETRFAKISKEAQGDFFYYHMIWIHSHAFSNSQWFDFPLTFLCIRLSSVLQIRNKDLSFNIDLALLHTKSMFLVICKYPMINAFLTSCWHLFNLKNLFIQRMTKFCIGA